MVASWKCWGVIALMGLVGPMWSSLANAQELTEEPLPDSEDEPEPDDEWIDLPESQEPDPEEAMLDDEVAETLEIVADTFVDVYGRDRLEFPEAFEPLEDVSELDMRLEEVLTERQHEVLKAYAAHRPVESPYAAEVFRVEAMVWASFYAVGSGMGDRSSNLYRFEVVKRTIKVRLFWRWYVFVPVTMVVRLTPIGETRRELTDIAYRYNNGSPRLYAVDNGKRLYRLNPTNGAATRIGTIGHYVNALTWCQGNLYGWGTEGKLFTINPDNADHSNVGSVGYQSSGDLACDFTRLPFDVYGSAVDGDVLIRINRSNGAGTFLGSLGGPGMYGLAFNYDMYVGRHGGSAINVRIVSKETGQTQWVGVDHPTMFGLYGMAPETWQP
jgi:hypothetical protein